VQDWLEAEREIDCMLNEGAPREAVNSH
jgi:hypothetical protein